jgi:Na+-transporting methylmalonyl-CoA/oxaloacetate decarboxylase gamma subunit
MNKKPNIKIIVYSIIAFIFLALTFLVNWIFIIGAVIMVYLNQKELKSSQP